jgi:hypothetical protein
MSTYLRAAVPAGLLVALTVCAAVATQWLILGSRTGGWQYPYARAFTPGLMLPALAVSAVASALLSIRIPRSRRGEWLLILVWVIVATGCHGALRSLTPYTFEQIFVSDGANSFFTASQQHDAATFLRRFAVVRDAMPIHAQSNMPGKLLLVFALETITTRPAVLAWLIVAVSNAGAFLIYGFVRQLHRGIERPGLDSGGQSTIALYAAVLYLFVPARLYFFPLMNTVTPVVVLACACLLMRWLRRATYAAAALFGVALYALIFFEPLPLVVGLLFAGLLLRAIHQGSLPWEQAVLQAAVAIVALIATSEIVHRLTGFELIAALRDVGAHAAAFNRVEGRPYGIWVAANLVEFGFGAGVCQVVLCGAVLAERVRAAGTWSDRLTDSIAVLTCGIASVLVVTDLIGLNRGEVIRLWIFLACFFQIPAAYACAQLNGRAAIIAVVSVSVLQAALGTAMIGFVVP